MSGRRGAVEDTAPSIVIMRALLGRIKNLPFRNLLEYPPVEPPVLFGVSFLEAIDTISFHSEIR